MSKELFDQQIETIKNAIYGEEVRGAIVNGLNIAYSDISAENESMNLFGNLNAGYIPVTKIDGFYVNNSNGEITEYDGWSVSDYIPCSGYDYLVAYVDNDQGTIYNAFYTSSKTFISSFKIYTQNETKINIPSNAAYFVVSYATEDFYDLKIKSFYQTKKDSQRAFENFIFKYGVEQSKNLLNLDTITNGYYLDVNTGGLLTDTDYFVSDFISIEPETRYAFCKLYGSNGFSIEDYTHYVCFYDEDKIFISSSYGSLNAEATSPKKAKYMRFSASRNSLDFKTMVIPYEYFTLIKNKFLEVYDYYGAYFNGDNSYNTIELVDATNLYVSTDPYYESTEGVYFKFDNLTYRYRGCLKTLTWNDTKSYVLTERNDYTTSGSMASVSDNIYDHDLNYERDVAYLVLSDGRYLALDAKTGELTKYTYNLDYRSLFPKGSYITLIGYDDNLKRPFGALYDLYIRKTRVQYERPYFNDLTVDMNMKLDQKEKGILKYAVNTSFIFGFVTDNHESQRYDERKDYTMMAMKRICDELSVDAIINCGDSVLGDYNAFYKCMNDIFKYIPAKDQLYCIGNHDRGDVVGTESTVIDYNEFFNLVYRSHRNDDKYTFPKYGEAAYFYVDYDKFKTRIVSLDPYYVSDTYKNEYTNNAGLNQEQLSWLVNDALVLEEGWRVMILVHMPPVTNTEGMLQNGNSWINYLELRSILEDFKNGSGRTITKNNSSISDGSMNLNLTYSFESQGPRDIICCLSGHTHVDNHVVINGINYISRACGYIDILIYFGQGNGTDPGGDSWQRYADDYSAICFDICSVNYSSRAMTFNRFGWGNDLTINW